MSNFKDKLTRNERLYVFAVPFAFLIGFGAFLLQYIFNLNVEFDINGKSGTMINVIGAIITGYSLSCACTIIHYMLNAIRAKQGIIKVLLILLFVPALFGGAFVSAIVTIPYCYSCSKKITRIKTDNEGILLKWQTISIIVMCIIDIVILIAYFICQH